jgi:hypothetical protein
MLVIVLSYIAFIMLRCIYSILSNLIFYHEVVLNPNKGFFCIYRDNQVVFVFTSINVLYYIYWIAYVEPSFHTCDEAELVMVNDLSGMLFDSVYHYSIEDFCFDVH